MRTDSERDYDEKTVLKGNWKSALWPYTKNEQIFVCPSKEFGYVFNAYLSGASAQQIGDFKSSQYKTTPTVFDSTSTQLNAADFGTSFVTKGAHPRLKIGRGTNVLFFDGHVEWRQQKPIFQAMKPLPTPLPPSVIQELPVKRDAWGRVIVKIEATKQR